MTADFYIDIPGMSGWSYRYWGVEFPRDAGGLHATAANYAFIKELANGSYAILYAGEADNIANRLPSHESWDEALRAGMTMVVAHSTPGGEAARLYEERDVIEKWDPPLNLHHRTTGTR
jgi:hypothetical protein